MVSEDRRAEDKRADDRHDTKVKGVKPQREKTGPYASEVEDYSDNTVKSPREIPSDSGKSQSKPK